MLSTSIHVTFVLFTYTDINSSICKNQTIISANVSPKPPIATNRSNNMSSPLRLVFFSPPCKNFRTIIRPPNPEEYLIPKIPLWNPFSFLFIVVREFYAFSEEKSEMAFLLVENYNYDRSCCAL